MASDDDRPSDPEFSADDIPWGNQQAPPIDDNVARAEFIRQPGDEDDSELDPQRQEVKGAFERLKHFDKALQLRDRDEDKRRRAGHSNPVIAESMTDASHAERFSEAYGLDLRFDHRRDRWLYYDEPRWRPDIDGAVIRKAIEFARLRQREVLMITDKQTRETALKYFIGAESKTALDRAISLARCMPPIADSGDQWDMDPMLMGAPNCIVDLKTGYKRDGDPADRITMSIACEYDPHAEAPRWRRFILEIFNDDHELATWVQKFVGYAITGLTHEQILAFFYGRGSNGKGTMMNTLAYVLGDYAYNMPFSTVEMRQRSAIPNDVAALDKRRWVTASETNDGTRLNEARIKALTGCDPITARFLHGEWFTFQPVAKFVLAVNHKPSVQDESYGFWRRMRLVPFKRQFSGAEKDPTLESHFKTVEASGIFRWAVEGCLLWQKEGLGLPGAIAEATRDYQTDSDPLNEFMSACIEDDPGNKVAASAVQAHYAKWADSQALPKGERLNTKALGQKLADKVNRRHTKTGWIYEDIRLITNNLF